jgi:hypothetical protein
MEFGTFRTLLSTVFNVDMTNRFPSLYFSSAPQSTNFRLETHLLCKLNASQNYSKQLIATLPNSVSLILHCTFYKFCSFFEWPERSKSWRESFDSWLDEAWHSKTPNVQFITNFKISRVFLWVWEILKVPICTPVFKIFSFNSKLLCYLT